MDSVAFTADCPACGRIAGWTQLSAWGAGTFRINCPTCGLTEPFAQGAPQ